MSKDGTLVAMEKPVKLTKGQASKKKIISEARSVFNRMGSQITILELARELEEGVSYITNHFRTKDHLIVAIAEEYEEKYYEKLAGHPELKTLNQITTLISDIMDLQYEYRCAIMAVVISSNSQKVLFRQIQQSYQKNVANISRFIELLVGNRIVREDLLKKEEQALFRFQYVNLLTTWMMSLELYDHPSSYRKMKPLYLKGIISCFLPYFSKQGLSQYTALDFPTLSKLS